MKDKVRKKAEEEKELYDFKYIKTTLASPTQEKAYLEGKEVQGRIKMEGNADGLLSFY